MTPSSAVKLCGAYNQLMSEASNLTHSYMIVSADTFLSETLATEFIAAVTGRSAQDVPFLKDVYTLPSGDKVVKDDAEYLVETAYIMPTELNKKFFLVRAAETANEAAQNKLLKTLEEPPETAVIILLCANEYAMLPTVRSRCRIIRPDALSDEILGEVVRSEYPSCTNPAFAVAVASGNLTKLKEVASGGTETFDATLKMLTCMRKSSEIVPYAVTLTAKKEKLGDYIDALELIFRDCMVIPYRPSLIKLKNNVKDIAEISKLYTPEVAMREMPVLLRARKRIAAGGNVNSIVDELLFSILEVKAKCQK